MYFGLGYLFGHFEDIYPSNVVTFVTTDCVIMYLNDEVENVFEMLKKFRICEMLDNRATYMWISRGFIAKSSTEADRRQAYDQRIKKERAATAQQDKSL